MEDITLSPLNFTKCLKCKQIWKDLQRYIFQSDPVVAQFSIGLFPKTGNISGFVNGIGCICSHPLSGFVTSGETHHHHQALHNNTFLPRALILNFQTGAKCFYVILFVKNFGGLQGNLLGGILGSGRLVKSEPGEKWQWVVLLKYKPGEKIQQIQKNTTTKYTIIYNI